MSFSLQQRQQKLNVATTAAAAVRLMTVEPQTRVEKEVKKQL